MAEALIAAADALATPASEGQQPNAANEPASAPELEAEAGSDEENGELEGEGDELPPEPEQYELEHDGKKYKVPLELKDAFLRNDDYTRKTQAVAESKRAVEARQAEVDAAYNTSQEVISARAHVLNLDSALQQYQNVNWQQLEQEDPISAMSHWRQFQMLKDQRGQAAQYLDKTQADLSEKAQQATATRLRETRAFAEREIPGWTPDVDVKIVDFAEKELGFSREQLRDQVNPAVYRTLHLAMIGAEALKRKNAQPKTVAPAAQPLTKVTARGNPPATGLDDRLSTDEWMKRRNAQVTKRQG